VMETQTAKSYWYKLFWIISVETAAFELFICCIAPKIQGLHKGQADRLLCCYKKETMQFSHYLLPISHQ